MIIRTERTTLEPIYPALARRIIERDERDGDAWHPEYPFADELGPLRGLAESTDGDPIFGLYVIRDADGTAVGGLGFFGPPDSDGRVEFGYGLVPAARGAGLATEAVAGALSFVAAHGAERAAAETDVTNLASQRVLLKAGLAETGRTATTVSFAREL
ncbi:GNAT family N-acetyltransferase [Plantibacter cousiniae (nom. nud.)]|uniref:Protein N-acetyltransferase, RimJ/RimL family n=1 Tax=Plantibacter cousiniae (nom. nud.) TaxID=199709 RepID=A0ABY1LGK6_9MICO|nr:GNAT family N-acetyltransferase [Plantibacter cousiniae]SKC35897.1 Protein N-acetyltransferase, RimJ/RimL family [Plantibacter cousiniae]